MKLVLLSSCLLFLINIMPVNAYIGPGMAGGVLASIIGLIVAIFMIIIGVVYYPIKRYLKERKKKKIFDNKDI